MRSKETISVWGFNIDLVSFRQGFFPKSRLARHASLLEVEIHIAMKHFVQDPRLQNKAFIMEALKEKFHHNLDIFYQ